MGASEEFKGKRRTVRVYALTCRTKKRGWGPTLLGVCWREASGLRRHTHAHAEGINELKEGPRTAKSIHRWRHFSPVGTYWAGRRGAPSTPCPSADAGTPGSSSRPRLVMQVPSTAMHWALGGFVQAVHKHGLRKLQPYRVGEASSLRACAQMQVTHSIALSDCSQCLQYPAAECS